MRALVSILLLVLLLPAMVHGQAFSTTTRAVCYSRNVTSGETSMYGSCQDKLSAEFISSQQEAFGSDFREGDTATISWSCSSAFVPYPAVVEVDRDGEGSRADIAQAGILFCSSQDGFCLPSTVNDTYTYASSLYGNTTYVSEPDASLSYYTATFTQQLDSLEEDWYTIVAYCNFYSDADTVWSVSVAWNYVEVRPTAHLQSVSWAAELPVMVMSSILGAFLGVVLGFTMWHRDHVVMKISQVVFLEGMIVCAIICCAGTYTLSNPTKLKCMLRPWCNIVPLTMLFALLFAKNWRIIKVTSNAGSMKRIVVKSYTVVVLAGALTSVQVIIQATGQQLIDTTVEQAFGGADSNYVEVCGNGGYHDLFWWLSAGYCAVLLIFGAYLAFEASDLVSIFNESTYIAASTYCATFAGVIMMLVYDPLSHRPTVYFLFASILELIVVTSTIGMLMYPKFVLIWENIPLSLSITSPPIGGGGAGGVHTERSHSTTVTKRLNSRVSLPNTVAPERVNSHTHTRRTKSARRALSAGKVNPLLSPTPSLTDSVTGAGVRTPTTERVTPSAALKSERENTDNKDTTEAGNCNSSDISTSPRNSTPRTSTTLKRVSIVLNNAAAAAADENESDVSNANSNAGGNNNGTGTGGAVVGDVPSSSDVLTAASRVSLSSSCSCAAAVRSFGSFISSCWAGMLKLAKIIGKKMRRLLRLRRSGVKVQVEGKGGTATPPETTLEDGKSPHHHHHHHHPSQHHRKSGPITAQRIGLGIGLSPSTADLFGVSTTTTTTTTTTEKPAQSPGSSGQVKVRGSAPPLAQRSASARGRSGKLMLLSYDSKGVERQHREGSTNELATVYLPREVANTANDAQNALRQMVRQHFCGLTIQRQEFLSVLQQQESATALLRGLVSLPDNDNHHHNSNNNNNSNSNNNNNYYYNNNNNNMGREDQCGGDQDSTLDESTQQDNNNNNNNNNNNSSTPDFLSSGPLSVSVRTTVP